MINPDDATDDAVKCPHCGHLVDDEQRVEGCQQGDEWKCDGCYKRFVLIDVYTAKKVLTRSKKDEVLDRITVIRRHSSGVFLANEKRIRFKEELDALHAKLVDELIYERGLEV